MKSTARTSQNTPAIVDDPRWAQVLRRDPQADGVFYISVTTTGVYCRPSCPSRHPRPENVRFHATCAEAEAAGFRPCRRCRPDRPSLAERHAAIIAESCRMMAVADHEPRLEELAAQAGLSPFYFHRLFRQISGLTPKEYWMTQREQRVRAELAHSGTVTEAIYDAGYHSSSRFYARAQEVLGMTPNNYRLGGANLEICFATGHCSLGGILVARSERGLCAIFFGDDPQALIRELQDRFPKADLIGGDGEFEQLVAQVVEFVETPGLGLDLPLDVRGTVFQQRVWQALRQIPLGQTATYAEIADRIGAPKAVRAVGQACGANPLAVVIPCHRVVRTDGGLSGYHWGVERKQALLEKERQLASINPG
jgi:AraC family transcriptional regulator of adaptative response/methylated-DNA-[protein]-cysteine methyltransferase